MTTEKEKRIKELIDSIGTKIEQRTIEQNNLKFDDNHDSDSTIQIEPIKKRVSRKKKTNKNKEQLSLNFGSIEEEMAGLKKEISNRVNINEQKNEIEKNNKAFLKTEYKKNKLQKRIDLLKKRKS